ncbi:putative sugar epimerase YhfK [Enterococcus florum]|uniref:Putative sugar epimerase YhfK n=1 Tax=Enterococcus florum TaxID=2480627 RepID=A0A4P5PEU0_9ENTE|nr:SDR family oxidoreductase [Enterococcus florum]GCF94861.1 putative sugar epimerase YhfK [Enterococcus florum]
MKVFVIGANGQIGKHVVKQLHESSQHEVVAMVRKSEQAEALEQQGIEVRVVDLEGPIGKIAEAAQDADAIVFTAGSGGATGADKTMLIDLDGAIKSIKAAEQAQVDRFVMVSAIGSQQVHAENPPEWINQLSYYNVAKFYADQWLMASDLEYTIIRPGGLTNDSPTGKVKIGETLEFARISREDVATAIVASLETAQTIRKAFDIVNGETPIKVALTGL